MLYTWNPLENRFDAIPGYLDTDTSLSADSDIKIPSQKAIKDYVDRKTEVPYYNVKSYGADGDGTTDDTDAVQNVLDAAPEGSIILFPPGSYVLGSISVAKAFTISGYGATILPTAGATGFAIALNSTVDRLTFEGFHFLGDGTTALATGGCIWNSSGASPGTVVTNAVFRDMEFKDLPFGLEINATNGGSYENTVIQNCRFINPVGTVSGSGLGLAILGGYNTATKTTVTGCVFEGAGRHGLYVSNGMTVAISGCHFRNHRRGEAITGTPTTALALSRCYNVIATGNTFEGNADVSVHIGVDYLAKAYLPTIRSQGIIVANNLFRDNDATAIMIGTDTPDAEQAVTGYTNGVNERVVITGNVIDIPTVRKLTGLAMSAGDATLTSDDDAFAAADVGSAITVVGAGAGGSDLTTTIASRTDATEVELADTATTAVTGAKATMPLDITSSAIVIRSGKKVTVTQNQITSTGRSSGYTAIGVYAYGVANFSDDYSITDNVVTLSTSTGTTRGIALAAGVYEQQAAVSVSALGAVTDLSGGTDNTLKVSVDGDAAETVTLDESACTTGDLTAAEMQTKIRALGGNKATATVTYSGDLYVISSPTAGASTAVVVTNGDANNAADDLRLGLANGGSERAGGPRVIIKRNIVRAAVAVNYGTITNTNLDAYDPTINVGTANYVAKYTAAGRTIGDSTITDDGSTVTVGSPLSVSTNAIFLKGSSGNTMARPAVGTSRVAGEIAGYGGSGTAADDGFVRLSAGGGTTAATKSFIDLSGYSNAAAPGYPDMLYNIVFGVQGVEKMRLNGTGLDIDGTVTGGTYNTATLSGGSLSATAVNGVTTADILLSSGSYSSPAWLTQISGGIVSGDISGNAANVTGTVLVGHGGTGLTTIASGKLLYASALDTLSALTLGTTLTIDTGTLDVTSGTYQTPLVISTGLTNTGGTVTNNLSTGVAGGQTAIGGTLADNVLTLQANSAVAGNTTTATAIQIKVGDNGGTTAITVLNNGNFGVGTTTPAIAGIVGTPVEIVGSLKGGAPATDTTTKNFYQVTRHYDNTEQDFLAFLATSTVNSNIVTYGGGSSVFNTATQMNFYTASNNTTLTGTNRMRIWFDGGITIGGAYSASPGASSISVDGKVIIGAATSTGGKLEVLATTEQLRLDYSAAVYTSFTTNSAGNLKIAPTGGNMAIGADPLSYLRFYSNWDNDNAENSRASVAGYMRTTPTADSTNTDYAFYGEAQSLGAYAMGTLQGAVFMVRNNSTGLLSTAVGASTSIVLQGATNTGDITTAYGFKVNSPSQTGGNSGGIDTIYGLHIAAQAAGFVTTAYGVYQAGASDINYLAGNTGIGQLTFGTDATKTLAVGTGTAPSDSPANAFQMYSADIVAGNAAPHFRSEAGDLIKLFKGAVLTTALTTITHTAPGTPDYAVQDLVQNTGFGFVTKDEGNTVLSVIANLQARINDLETRLQAVGLLT